MCKPAGATKIFIAEDNRADVFLIREALRAHGITAEFEVAENGETAREKILEMNGDAGLCPDLFIIDLNLPRVSGHEVLGTIRRHSSCSRKPVVVLTSSCSPSDEERALKAGADRYIIKPDGYEGFLGIGSVLRALLQPH